MEPPTTHSIDTVIPVAPFATGWQTGLLRPQRIKLLSLSPAAAVPGVASMAINPVKLRTTSYRFPELPGWLTAPADKHTAPLADAAGSPGEKLSEKPDAQSGERAEEPPGNPPGVPPSSLTRIRPPSDVIKLEDRLYYLLQPALETDVARRRAGVSLSSVPLSIGRGCVLVSAGGGGARRRNGLGQDDAGDHRRAAAAARRRSSPRAADLPQAAGDQLAARVCPVGAGNAADGDRRGPRPPPLAMAVGRRSRESWPTTNCCIATGRCSRTNTWNSTW